MQVINLLSDIQLDERKAQRKNTLVLFGFFMTLAVLGFVVLALAGLFFIQKGAKDELKKKILAQKTVVDDVGLTKFGVKVRDPRTGTETTVHVEEAGRLIQNQLTTIDTLRASQLSWKQLLINLAEITPAEVQITDIKVNPDLTLDIGARTSDIKGAAKMANQLKNYHGDLVTLALKNNLLVRNETDGSISTNFTATDLGAPANSKVSNDEDDLRAKLLIAPADDPLKTALKKALQGKIETSFLFSNVNLSSVSRDTVNSYSFLLTVNTSPELFKKD